MSKNENSFCFPVRRLENSELVLEPFDFARHAEPFVQGCKGNSELFAYVRHGPFTTVADFESWYRSRIDSADTETLFAILKRTAAAGEEENLFAGVIGLQNANVFDATIEIGFITVLPNFQRSSVASTAVGLLLLYVLDRPPSGLALRRCQWQAHNKNEPSKRLALRLGFTFESVQRFERVVPLGKIGNGYDTSYLTQVNGEKSRPSRDSAVFAHYCDEWLEKRQDVVQILGRR